MKIYVIRHGLTELNKQKVLNSIIDEPLAREGIEQVRVIASRIPKSVTHIYSSPLIRTRQTAEIINARLKRLTSFHKELREIHMGALAGKSWHLMDSGEELKHKHRSIQFDYRPHGGESAEDVKKRIISLLKKLKANHGSHEALIVTHGGVIRTLHLLEHGKHQLDELENASLLIFDLDKILNNFQSARKNGKKTRS